MIVAICARRSRDVTYMWRAHEIGLAGPSLGSHLCDRVTVGEVVGRP